MLRDDINNALKDAMKAKDERKVSTLRHDQFVAEKCRYRGAGQREAGARRCETLPLLQKMIKQRQELVELYQKGGRADLVEAGAGGDRDHLRVPAAPDVRGRK